MLDAAGVRFWYALYNVFLHLGALLCLPVWLFLRFVRGRYRGQFRERMGLFPESVRRTFGSRPALWVHAASAGETASAAPLVAALHERLPDHCILFTVTSRYGKEMATRRLEGTADAVCFSPLDLPLFCRRFLDRIRPELYVMVETDLWPNLVRSARRRGIPVALASGHAGPRRFPRPFWRAVLSHLDLMLMQTGIDAENLVRRGAPVERVHVMGNLKFDGSGRKLARDRIPAWRAELGLPPGAPVLVAGSTLADDEGPVLEAVVQARAAGHDLHAIVAPRRTERVPEVERGCRERGLASARRTTGGKATVLILDTMGELARSYSVASVAYVGGGLTAGVGLHNLIEPLVCGVPVLFGPHRGKAARIAEEIAASGAGIEIRGGTVLPAVVLRLLADSQESERLVAAGAAMLERHRGAAARQAARIVELLA